MDYPIQTVATFANIPQEKRSSLIEFGKELHLKAETLEDQGKTLAYANRIGENVVKRTWINQEAAEEWKSILTQTAERHSIDIISIEIGEDDDR